MEDSVKNTPRQIGLVHLDRIGTRRWLTLSTFGAYLPSLNATVMVPQGFRTDGGSVPLWRLALALTGVLLMFILPWRELGGRLPHDMAVSLFIIGFVLALAGIAMLAIDRNGRMLPAFILHDYITGTGMVNGRPITFLQGVRALWEAGQACGACRLERVIVCGGLAAGGWWRWRECRRRDVEEPPSTSDPQHDLCLTCGAYGHGCPLDPQLAPVHECVCWKPKEDRA